MVGGQFNEAGGTNALAAGNHAKALHNGAFVWADFSSPSDFASIAKNEFAVRATGGLRLESELGTNVLTNKKLRFADNNIVAWARVPASGVLGQEHFGFANCTNQVVGTYNLTLDVNMVNSIQVIPIATIEADDIPVSAETARLIYVNQTTGTSQFTVYITTGAYVPVNNAFVVMFTGR